MQCVNYYHLMSPTFERILNLQKIYLKYLKNNIFKYTHIERFSCYMRTKKNEKEDKKSVVRYVL